MSCFIQFQAPILASGKKVQHRIKSLKTLASSQYRIYSSWIFRVLLKSWSSRTTSSSILILLSNGQNVYAFDSEEEH